MPAHGMISLWDLKPDTREPTELDWAVPVTAPSFSTASPRSLSLSYRLRSTEL